eukprot:781736_1
MNLESLIHNHDFVPRMNSKNKQRNRTQLQHQRNSNLPQVIRMLKRSFLRYRRRVYVRATKQNIKCNYSTIVCTVATLWFLAAWWSLLYHSGNKENFMNLKFSITHTHALIPQKIYITHKYNLCNNTLPSHVQENIARHEKSYFKLLAKVQRIKELNEDYDVTCFDDNAA